MDFYYIYKITNNLDGKTYIGQHKYNSNKYADDYESLINDGYWGSGLLIRRAYKKSGKNNFSKDVLVSHLECKEAANDAEKYFIECYRDLGKAEYNITDGGDGTIGVVPSKETRNKWSQTYTGRSWFNDGKNEVFQHECPKGFTPGRLNLVGIPFSEEHKRKLSESKMGHSVSEETREKLRLANLGKKYSEETKNKVSKSLIGNKRALGRHWFNNGIIQKTAFECPEGFTPGKLKRK